MKCFRCGQEIPDGEEMDYYGQTLCEECYLQAMSPNRSCDPWAVRSAQVLSKLDESYSILTETQSSILQILTETGGVEAEVLAEILKLKMTQLERELATLRHMEKVRAKMQAEKKIICLWES